MAVRIARSNSVDWNDEIKNEKVLHVVIMNEASNSIKTKEILKFEPILKAININSDFWTKHLLHWDDIPNLKITLAHTLADLEDDFHKSNKHDDFDEYTFRFILRKKQKSKTKSRFIRSLRKTFRFRRGGRKYKSRV